MAVTKLTKKHQTTIPVDIRNYLKLKEGDRVDFEICNNQVILKKVTPLEYEYLQSLEGTLQEWDSVEDNEAYNDL